MSIFTFSKNSFEGQLPDEKTLLVARKHWIFLFIPLMIISLLVVGVILIGIVLSSFSWWKSLSSLYIFLSFVLFLILWNLLFYGIMIYSLNTVIITNKRIIENQQLGLFKHAVNEIELKNIQDISIKILGPFAQLLNYGNIEIQSAGAIAKFNFTKLPDPQKIKNIIIKAKQASL